MYKSLESEDDDLKDPSFQKYLKHLVEKRELPPREKSPPQRFGLQLPSSEVLDKWVIEGTDEEIKSYEKMKEEIKKDKEEMMRRRLEARQLYADLTRSISTQTNNNEAYQNNVKEVHTTNDVQDNETNKNVRSSTDIQNISSEKNEEIVAENGYKSTETKDSSTTNYRKTDNDETTHCDRETPDTVNIEDGSVLN